MQFRFTRMVVLVADTFEPGGIINMQTKRPLAQPLRGLINILLDAQTPPAPIVAAARVMRCQ